MAYLHIKLAVIAALIAVTSAACVDQAGCPRWVSAGFCYNRFYTNVQKAMFCPVSCNKCGVVVPSTTPRVTGTTASRTGTTATRTTVTTTVSPGGGK